MFEGEDLLASSFSVFDDAPPSGGGAPIDGLVFASPLAASDGFSLTLRDDDASMFNSLDLPSSIELMDLEAASAEVLIDSTSTLYDITFIETRVVPAAPSAMCLASGLLLAARRRR